MWDYGITKQQQEKKKNLREDTHTNTCTERETEGEQNQNHGKMVGILLNVNSACIDLTETYKINMAKG